MQNIWKTCNTVVDMSSALKGKLHDQAIVDIVTEVKYPGGIYYIIDPENKEILQQTAKEQYPECALIL